MKVIAFNGSPKANGNTREAIELVANELKTEGIDVEIIHVGNKEIRGCIACNACKRNKDEKCILEDEYVNDWIQKMKEADGILLGSPVYSSAINSTLKAFLDRSFYVGYDTGVEGGSLFRHKVGATIVTARRAGGLPALNELNNFLNYSEMVIPTSNYWNVIYGGVPGDIKGDLEGQQIMRLLGKNMAWIMKIIENGKNTLKAPEAESKISTPFIR